MTTSSFIPYNLPSIGVEEINEVVETLKSGWLTTGPRTTQFEREIRDYVQAPCSLAVNSATAGLHLSLAALGIKAGDEVITTPMTFCSTVNTILQVGATPVLADIGADGNIDPASIAERVTDRTRAIVPVHIGGLPCDMTPIWEIARRHGLRVVEDAAHAIGSRYRGRPIGDTESHGVPHSDSVVFSFYATKNLTTGEGGMITTADRRLEERMRTLCLHGINKDVWNRYTENGNWFYQVVACGFKYNLTDIQAAIGIHQLRKQEQFITMRTRVAERYNEVFSDVPELELPPDKKYCRNSWHLYPLRLNLEKLDINRAEFIQALKEKGIGASVHFIPIPLHPYFAGLPSLVEPQCPRALALYPRLVSIPLYPSLDDAAVDRVTEAVTDIVRSARRDTVLAVSTGTE